MAPYAPDEPEAALLLLEMHYLRLRVLTLVQPSLSLTACPGLAVIWLLPACSNLPSERDVWCDDEEAGVSVRDKGGRCVRDSACFNVSSCAAVVVWWWCRAGAGKGQPARESEGRLTLHPSSDSRIRAQ